MKLKLTLRDVSSPQKGRKPQLSPIDTQQDSTPKAGGEDTDRDVGALTVFGSAPKAAPSINRSLQDSAEAIHEIDGKEPGQSRDARNARNIQRQAVAMKMANMHIDASPNTSVSKASKGSN